MSPERVNDVAAIVNIANGTTDRRAILETIHTMSDYISQTAAWPDQVPVLAFPKDTFSDFEYFTAAQLNGLTDEAVVFLQGQGLQELADDASTVVTLLGPAGVEYLATFLALMQLGYTVFPMSPRLSVSAIIGLLEKTCCNVIIPSKSTLPRIRELKASCKQELTVLRAFSHSKSSDGCALASVREPLMNSSSSQSSKIGLIWHSSGSTGTPKIFPMTHEDIMARIRYNQNSPFGQKSRFITSSLYNSGGLSFTLSAIAARKTTYLYNDALPYTADGLSQALLAAQPYIAFVMPYALELLASTSAGVTALQSCSNVNVFGAVCPTALGDRLVEQGVKISLAYAMSETGTLMSSSLRPPGDKNWEFVSAYPDTRDHVWMKPLENDLHECVVLPGHANCTITNSNDPPNSFYTGDIFVAHESLPNRWKIIGRKDDIVKTAFADHFPVLPFEDYVKQHSAGLVEEAVVFGNGRPRLGLIVLGGKQARDLPSAEFIRRIWPTIEELNARNPRAVRVEMDMIIAVQSEERWPCTDKQNIMRPQVYRLYEALIKEKYADVDEKCVAKPSTTTTVAV